MTKYQWFCRICGRDETVEYEIDKRTAVRLHKAAIATDKLRNPMGHEALSPQAIANSTLLGPVECKGDLRFGVADSLKKNRFDPSARPELPQASLLK